jgi:hypothetical protein
MSKARGRPLPHRGNRGGNREDRGGEDPNRKKKYRWIDPQSGNTYSAGGIMFYTNDSLWLIEEKNGKNNVLTDIGGKYNIDDGNIWTCIRRELEEETYGLCDVRTSDIIHLSSESSNTGVKCVIVTDHHKNAMTSYMCIAVPVNMAPLGVVLDPEEYDRRREVYIKQNPDAAANYYKPLKLVNLPIDKLHETNLSYRLRRILVIMGIIDRNGYPRGINIPEINDSRPLSHPGARSSTLVVSNTQSSDSEIETKDD